MLDDCVAALRMIRRRPGFTVAAALTLALGIGANVAVFSAVRAVLLDDLPYPDADRLLRLLPADHMAGFPIAVKDLDALRGMPAFSGVMACSGPQVVPLSSRPAVLIAPMGVTVDFFDVLGVPPRVGRVLVPADFSPGVSHVVISYELWRTRFASDPEVIGRTVSLNRAAWTVVGVMPPAFSPPCFDTESAQQAWIPLTDTTTRPLTVIARLAPPATIAAAQAQVDRAMQALVSERGDSRYANAYLERLGASQAEALESGLLLLQGVAALLWLIATANLAAGFLVHMATRQAEFAVRCGLGATPGRIVRHVVAEATVIATIGAAAGTAVAFVTSGWLRSIATPVLPQGIVLGFDARDLVFGLGVGWLTAVLFGTVPALLAARAGAGGATTRVSVRATSSPLMRRLGQGFVGAQVVLMVILLTASGVLMRSFVKVMSIAPGFSERGLLATEVYLPESTSTSQLKALIGRLESEIHRTAGVTAVAFSDSPAFVNGRGVRWGVRVPGVTQEVRRSFALKQVSQNYFDVLRVPVRRGHAFDAAVAPGVLQAVVSEDFARVMGDGREIIGTTLTSPEGTFLVVGVVGNVRTTRLTDPTRPTAYVQIAAMPTSQLSVMGRSSTIGPAVAGIEQAVRTVNPDGPEVAVEPLAAAVWRSESTRRFYLVLIALFAGLSTVVAAVGIYSACARVVTVRTKELGIRSALGARPIALLRLVIAEGLRPVVVGTGIGVLGAWWAGRLLGNSALLQSLLFQTQSTDQVTVASVVAGILLVALFACWVPARRSTRTDPSTVLREY